jgi:preprotein translocase subunit Sec63
MEKDYYKILGVPKDASQDDIKKAFHSVSIPSQFRNLNLTRLAHCFLNMAM